MVSCGVEWCGVARFGVVWRCAVVTVVWCGGGLVWSGLVVVWCCVVLYGVVMCVVSYGVVWCGVAMCDVVSWECGAKWSLLATRSFPRGRTSCPEYRAGLT